MRKCKKKTIQNSHLKKKYKKIKQNIAYSSKKPFQTLERLF